MAKSVSLVFGSAQLVVLLLICWCALAAAGCGLESATTLTLTCDGRCRNVYVDGVEVEPTSNPRRRSNWHKANTFLIPAGAQVLAVKAKKAGEGQGGILASMDNGEVSDGSWRISTTDEEGWAEINYSGENWEAATSFGQNGVEPWGAMPDFADNANWIWSDQIATPVYFRKLLGAACSTATDPVVMTCPEDFVYDTQTDVCFKLYEDEKSRTEANTFCHSLEPSARLFVLDTAEKLQTVKEHMPPNQQWWLGGLQEENEGPWFWETGQEITELWAPVEPNQYQGRPEDCVILSTAWNLNDVVCTLTTAYICEYVMN